MYTKKIEIKNEEHFNEVVKALKSMGENIWSKLYEDWVTSLVFNSGHSMWYKFGARAGEEYKSAPEYEIVAKTSYELKEVPKIKITCKNCGKTVEYKDLNDMFKDFVIFEGKFDHGNQTFSYLYKKIICKDCMIELINN